MVREIVLYGDPVLRGRCLEAPRHEITSPALQELIDDMVETMHAAHGIGLAAPQLGEAVRVIVFDIGDEVHIVVNPKILRESGEQTGFEGCLSIPGLQGEVTRSDKVVMRGYGRDGREVKIKGEGLLARVMLHEFDHLNGILFVDKATPGTLEWITAEEIEGEEVERV